MRIAASAFILSALLAQLATAKTVTTTKTRSYRTVKLTAAQLDAELHARQAHATAYSNGVSVNTTIVGAWRQCAGKNWIAPCSTGTTCVARSDLYSECIPNEYVVRHADGRWVFKHGEPVVEVEVDVDYVVSEAGEWEQCLWEDRRLACAPGLHCAELHPWFGQCVANDEHHVHNREHVVRRWVEDEDVVVHHHHREGRAAQWEQCKWEHDEIECAPGLQCAVQSKFFGQCVKRDALLWEQCGGLNWVATCELGSTCVKRDDVYSQCVPVATEEYVNHEHHHHHHHHHHNHHVHHHEAPKPKPPVIEIAKEWEQCKWDDKLIDCAAGLQCAIRNDWFGQCVRTAAVAWEQCGGSFWTATCSAGNTCVKRDEHYSQCVPNDRLDHHLHHKREHVVHTTEHVHRHPKIVETVAFWEQCAGIDWSSACTAGSICVKRDARFGQCIPHDHLATHRRFSWHGDHTHWVDDEPEVVVVVESEVQLWDQCLWRGRQLECAAGLQCAAQSEWFGQCVPTVAAIGEQCGGQFWTAVCAAGSKCVERDALYSHCVPVTHHHHHHRRADEFVVHREPVAARVAVAKEFEQCKWEDARVDCAAGLRCVVHNKWFGQCVRAVAAAGEQCSGLHWTAPCAAGSTCVQRDEHFGECVPTATTTRHAPHHHHEEVRHYHDSHHHVDHHHDHRRHGHWVYEVEVDAVPVVHTRAKAGEFEQCKWENDEVECAAGLQCAVESDWFGQCVKREAELWGQCGGRHWLAACPVGSKCVHRRDDFKQCLPVA